MHRARPSSEILSDLPPDGTTAWLAPLDRLAAILDGHRWLVAGGLAVPLSLGRFYRPHRDIDVVVPFAGMGGVDDAMRAAGYRLTTRVSFHLGTRRITLRLPLRGRGPLLRLRCRKLRYLPQRGVGALRPRHLDVMPFDLVDGHIAPRNMDRRVPLTEPIEGCRIVLPSGREVTVLHLHYVRALMHRPGYASRSRDLAVMDEALDYGSLTTAGPPESARDTSQIA